MNDATLAAKQRAAKFRAAAERLDTLAQQESCGYVKLKLQEDVRDMLDQELQWLKLAESYVKS